MVQHVLPVCPLDIVLPQRLLTEFPCAVAPLPDRKPGFPDGVTRAEPAVRMLLLHQMHEPTLTSTGRSRVVRGGIDSEAMLRQEGAAPACTRIERM